MEKEYIGREALLNDIEEIRPINWTDTEAEITEQADFDCFENLVKSQPTADVLKVRHGKWIMEYLGNGEYRYKCSHCSAKVGRSYVEDFGHKNFCHNCGTKMDKE